MLKLFWQNIEFSNLPNISFSHTLKSCRSACHKLYNLVSPVIVFQFLWILWKKLSPKRFGDKLEFILSQCIEFFNLPNRPFSHILKYSRHQLATKSEFSVPCYCFWFFKVLSKNLSSKQRITIITKYWIFQIAQQNLLSHIEILQTSACRKPYILVSPVIVFQFLQIL